MAPQSFQELLDFAIKQEEEAVAFYSEWSAKVTNASVRKTFLDFAQQERGHKAKLEELKASGRIVAGEPAKARELNLSDYLVGGRPSPGMSFQEALVLAMKKEKAAYRMYSDLAARAGSDELCQVFRYLAQEEAAHKLAFELEYDDLVFQEN